MLKLLSLIVLFCGTCPEVFSEQASVKAFCADNGFIRLFFEGHSYIKYNSAMLHDPDCGCHDQWISVPLDNGAYMFRRIRPSDYD